MNRALLSIVICFAIGMMFCGSVVAKDPEDELLKLLIRVRPGDSDVRNATRFLEELQRADLAEDKRFLYYKALALKGISDKTAGLQAAKAAVESGYLPTLIESRIVADQWTFDLSPPPTEPDTPQKQRLRLWEKLDKQLKDYPYGEIEYDKISTFNQRPAPKSFKPLNDMQSAILAAQYYYAMNMPDDSLRMYNRAAGFCSIPGLFDGYHSTPLWQGVADCYAAKGEWEVAQGYYLKAMIGHDFVKELRDPFFQMGRNVLEKKVVEALKKSANAEELDKIVLLCTKCQQFPDALHAIEQIKALGKLPKVESQLAVHQAIVAMISDMRQSGYNGVTFRGILVSDENLEKERALVKDIQEALGGK